MLPTFIIGLREGLEAALIVGIIAAFLRQRGQGLSQMWLGVGAAIALSLTVGVGLGLIETALPQAAQEAMEAVIGMVAVIFVTGMIVWMMHHAHELKHHLQGELSEALGRSGVALTVMAFLAVLREGFETSVFLLATFSAAQSGALAAIGAALGLAVSVAIGWGIYMGGVRLNLARFFRWTSGFLILVAGGLVMSSLRSAHGAGWLIAGQAQLADLGWLIAPGSLQSTLLTGVLGIPADPRLIEVLGWLAYLIPITLYVYWPRNHRPNARRTRQIYAALTVGLLALAAGLFTLWPAPKLALGQSAGLITQRQKTPLPGTSLALSHGTLTLTQASSVTRLNLADTSLVEQRHQGVNTQYHHFTAQSALTDAPADLDLATLATLNHGRLPVGVNPARNPGPFTAQWQRLDKIDLWTAQDEMLDAKGRSDVILTLADGGLQTPRTLRLSTLPDGTALHDWYLDPAYAEHAIQTARAFHANQIEYQFWARQLPLVLLVAALLLAIRAGQQWRFPRKPNLSAARSS
ncbi:iron uptake transporter permease EfeU [Aquicoccus sp. G2-2]|uniref:iron uptake transporter permease EfeU n=1 Tax=Aquicoccus sp. G2-2 TaxID=3092120 RepID=UPI002AE0178C|nr:iron uptake transporter permease EfeU [Aquicoccus sp. G2-2]MEA1114828.1 iron uptake transporter permease EfeU [Aquicoccus sp. G2-2]